MVDLHLECHYFGSLYMSDKFLIINNEFPLEEKHIGWTTARDFDEKREVIYLIEIVECKYPHPQAPEHAFVQQVELRFGEKIPISEHAAAPLILLEAAQRNIGLMKKKT